MNIPSILLQGTALMAALLLLRPLLKKFLSARARCALWAIPALRLLIPLEVESVFSVMRAAEPVVTAAERAVSRPVIAAPVRPAVPQQVVPALGEAASAVQAAPSGEAASALSLGGLLFLLWLAGAVIAAIWLIWANARFFRRAKRLATPFETDCPLPVYLLPELATPCLAGVFRPRIYINERALVTERVLEMTLRHELTHYRRLDHLWGLARGVLTVLYWFHPLVWLCGALFRNDCETACDEAATRSMDDGEREDYGLSLIALAGRKPHSGLLVCLSTMSGGKRLLYERISCLARSRRTVRGAAVMAALLALLLTCTMCTSPTEDASGPEGQGAAQGLDAAATGGGAQTAQPPENASQPAATLSHEAAELACCMEVSTLGAEFRDMDKALMAELLEEYGDLLDGYAFMGRERIDGQGSYILGEYQGEGESALSGLQMTGIGMSNILLYREEDYPDDWTVADLMAGIGDWSDYGRVITQSTVFQYFLDRPMVIITPKNDPSYNGVIEEYIQRGPAHIIESAEQGVMLTMPEKRPYLEVYLISEEYGETCAYIPLTGDEADAILAEERVELTEGFGFCARLYAEGEDVFYNEREGVPQTVLDLAVEKCGYQFADPSDITGPVLGATLDCPWLDGPIQASEADLARLEEILKNAEFGYVGACGYGAVLTLDLTGGETLTVFKGTDDCDTIVFGSWGGYFLGDAENTEFWTIFGLDPYTKEPLTGAG